MQARPFRSLDLRSVGSTVTISGLILSDAEAQYLIQFPSESDVDAHQLVALQATEQEWRQLLNQFDSVETEILAQAGDGTLTKAIVRKCERIIEQSIAWNVFRRDGYRCRYCYNDKVPLSVDHLVLWEQGGPTTEENLVAACKKCNRTRGNMQYGQWLQSRYYESVSRNLPDSVKDRNEQLVDQIKTIDARLVRRTRR